MRAPVAGMPGLPRTCEGTVRIGRTITEPARHREPRTSDPSRAMRRCRPVLPGERLGPVNTPRGQRARMLGRFVAAVLAATMAIAPCGCSRSGSVAEAREVPGFAPMLAGFEPGSPLEFHYLDQRRRQLFFVCLASRSEFAELGTRLNLQHQEDAPMATAFSRGTQQWAANMRWRPSLGFEMAEGSEMFFGESNGTVVKLAWNPRTRVVLGSFAEVGGRLVHPGPRARSPPSRCQGNPTDSTRWIPVPAAVRDCAAVAGSGHGRRRGRCRIGTGNLADPLGAGR